MKKQLLCMLLLTITPTLFCKKELKYEKLNYETLYADAASEKKLDLKNRLTQVRFILKHAPDSFFTKKKMLQKYRFKLKNLIVKLGKEVIKKQPALKKQYLQLIAMTFEKNTRAYKHIGRLHPKTMKRCIYRMFQKEIKAFKQANSRQIISLWAFTESLPTKKLKFETKLTNLKETQEKLEAKKSLNLFQKTKLKKTTRNIEKTTKWLDNYQYLNTTLVNMQKNAQHIKSNIRKKALKLARSADPIINTELNKKFESITKRDELNSREKFKIKKLIR
jgi:hypothetical protein